MSNSSTPEPTSDMVGRVETRGIDYIPEAERHGRPKQLFAVWAASNTTYLNIVFGGLMILLGLNVWQAMTVIVVGNLFWAATGFLAISGPRAGTPSSVVTRAMYGIRGNRICNASIGWAIAVAYQAINLTVGSLAAFALIEQLGIEATTWLKLLIVLAIGALTLTISIFGHATILRVSPGFAIVLAVCFAFLAVFVISHADVHYVADYAPSGSALWAVASVALTIVVSGPMGWTVGADYSRYLPASASKRAVAGWTALGGFLPAVLLGGIGVLAGTAVDMTDPQTSLEAILPGWFYPVFLLVIVVGSITNNVLTAYSSGLFLQAAGIPWRRAVTVFIDGVIAYSLVLYALFVSNFIDTMTSILALAVTLLGPIMAIYAADIILRRNRYDGLELHNETPTGLYWYTHGFNLAGVSALVLGTTSAVLCANTAEFVGPLSTALGGADISALIGPAVAATVYTILSHRQRRNTREVALKTTADIAAFPANLASE